MPHEDGYHWRKYGEKQINGTHFTRYTFSLETKVQSAPAVKKRKRNVSTFSTFSSYICCFIVPIIV
jgi:hypothetical protein